jgi:hypothetical protein
MLLLLEDLPTFQRHNFLVVVAEKTMERLPCELLCALMRYCTIRDLGALMRVGCVPLAESAIRTASTIKPCVEDIVGFYGTRATDALRRKTVFDLQDIGARFSPLIATNSNLKMEHPVPQILALASDPARNPRDTDSNGLLVCVIGKRATGKTTLVKRVAHTLSHMRWCNDVSVIRRYEWVNEYEGWDGTADVFLQRGDVAIYDDWRPHCWQEAIRLLSRGISVVIAVQHVSDIQRATRNNDVCFDVTIQAGRPMWIENHHAYQDEPARCAILCEISNSLESE